MTTVPVPTLADIVADGSKLADLPFSALWSLHRDLGLVDREITSHMLARAASPPVENVLVDHLLTHEEAGQRTGMSAHTMKRWAHRLPYSTAVVVLSRTRVRWSSQRLDDVLRTLGARPRRKAAV